MVLLTISFIFRRLKGRLPGQPKNPTPANVIQENVALNEKVVLNVTAVLNEKVLLHKIVVHRKAHLKRIGKGPEEDPKKWIMKVHWHMT